MDKARQQATRVIRRILRGVVLTACLTGALGAQPPAAAPGATEPAALPPPAANAAAPAGPRPVVRSQTGPTTLPSDQGQLWQEYDIRPYVTRIQGVEHPEQTIVDWILRETGTELWFRSPVGLLTAEPEKIRVFHTPEVQAKVADVVERFVRTDLNAYGVNVRLITLQSINWRSLALPYLRPITVQTPGVEAWLVSRENAAMLRAHMKGRVDYREHNSSNVRIPHGQSQTIEQFVPRAYAQGVNLTPHQYPGYQIQMAQLQEGVSLQISPLATSDGRRMEAVVRCSADQIEELVSLPVDLRAFGINAGTVQIEVPQVASWRLQERFQWPIEEVLVISRGLVAMPGLKQSSWANLPPLPGTQAPRADALLMLECRTESAPGMAGAAENPRVGSLNSNGRY